MESRYPVRRLSPAEVHRIEDRIAAQHREIQTLLIHNQHLAATHADLKQDVAAAHDDLRRVSATASSVKADCDAQVREIYERSLRLEAEARSIDGLSVELGRVRAEIKELRAERDGLSEKLKDINGDIARAQSELREMPALKSEIEAMQREIQRGRAAIEYERKMHSTNFELSEAMEKQMISLSCEAENLRSELANAEKRAMAMAAISTVHPGSGFDLIRY